MPLTLLTEAVLETYGQYTATPNPEQLLKFFVLEPRDLELVKQRRRERNPHPAGRPHGAAWPHGVPSTPSGQTSSCGQARKDSVGEVRQRPGRADPAVNRDGEV